jgi:hypothetical protein
MEDQSVQAFQIEIGTEYGFRDNPQRAEPLQRVKVLEHVRRRWKVEWVDPHPGLVDYVRSAQLVVAWRDRKAFLTDEVRWAALHRECERSWPGNSHPLSEAVDLVLDSTGEVAWIDNSGALCAPLDALERIGQRASLDLEVTGVAFVDRDGTARFPFAVGLDLAMSFARAEPRTVLAQVEVVERKYERESQEVGNEYLLPVVNRLRACWALCRQWAGFDEAIARREREIDRLRRIIEDLKYELRRSGQDELAQKLDRKLTK